MATQWRNNQPTKGLAKWAVVVATIATATAAAPTATMATMATGWRGGDAKETVMDGDGQCNDNTTATMAMEDTTATRQ